MTQAWIENSLGYDGGRGWGQMHRSEELEVCGVALAVRMRSRRGIRHSAGFVAGELHV